ncbi:DNA-binding response regulator [Pseudonocardiaceae bacterium YIM PH 21723]|nr:DNA-binding response regulator [Pseudonocardiaceae bacterium YIM PH 21723]
MTMTSVLVVDDQMLVRAGFVALLSAQSDLEVIGEAGDGHGAVELVNRHRPDVVLMDIRMPNMDGIEATKLIVAATGGETSVLILTTFDADEYVYAALRAGASGFLLKDTPPEELVKAVRIVAEGNGLLAPQVTGRLIRTFANNPSAMMSPRPPLPALTERETEVLVLVARGLSNMEIAEKLFVSEGTVKTHLNRLMAKVGVSSRAQAVIAAYESGLVTVGG